MLIDRGYCKTQSLTLPRQASKIDSMNMIDRMPREDMLGNAMLKSVSIRVHLWLNSILSILGHR